MRLPLILCLLLASAARSEPVPQGAPTAGYAPLLAGQTRAPHQRSGIAIRREVFTSGLERPWGIAALPGGGYLVSERPGRLRHVSATGQVSAPLSGVPKVHARGQGGLLDVALSVDFVRDRRIYLSYAKALSNGRSGTAVAVARLSDDLRRLEDLDEIFIQHPPSPTPMHYGSRVVPRRDGTLFITTGEHFTPSERLLAQDLDTTYGKVVHLQADGRPVSGGLPHGIWSYGHRNIQGAALDPRDGALWTIEHGPAGGDELNQPAYGTNHGWPLVSYGVNYDGSPIGDGGRDLEGVEQPIYYWDPVIAPAGMIFYTGAMFPEWRGDLLIGSLNPGGVVRLRLHGGRVVGEERFLSGAARIRDIEQAPDGSLLLLVDAPRGAIWRLSRP